MPPVFGTDVRTTVLDTHMSIPASGTTTIATPDSGTTTIATPDSGTTTTATPDSDGLFRDANPANV